MVSSRDPSNKLRNLGVNDGVSKIATAPLEELTVQYYGECGQSTSGIWIRN